MNYLFLFIFLVISTFSFSQDPLFSQTINGNVNLNSALVGNDTCARLATNYRNQWSGLGGGYITSSINFSQYISKFNGYGGIHYLNDNAFDLVKTNCISGFYSQNIKFKKVLFRPSIEVGVISTKIDESKLIFGDMIDPRKGFIGTSSEVLKNNKVTSLDLNFGAIVTYKNLLIGFSAHHLNSPKLGFNTGYRLPIRYSAQFSYAFNISKFRISPFAFINLQNGFQSTVGGLDFLINKHFNLAVSYRSSDALITNIGYTNNYFSINYSYDYTTSLLNNLNTGGTHELGLVVNFWKVKAHQNYLPVVSVF